MFNFPCSASLRKHPFLLALRRWGRFARRFLLAKRPQRRRVKKNGCFRRLIFCLVKNIQFSIFCIQIYIELFKFQCSALFKISNFLPTTLTTLPTPTTLSTVTTQLHWLYTNYITTVTPPTTLAALTTLTILTTLTTLTTLSTLTTPTTLLQ